MRYSIHDGPGIRTTVFLKGCPLSCAWCHNPESISPDIQITVNKNLCIRCGTCLNVCSKQAITCESSAPVIDPSKCNLCGKCAESCNAGALELIGRDYTVNGLFSEIAKDSAFYERSGGGVTFSGGEPLMQHEFLFSILDMCSSAGFHCAVDTSGFAAESVISKIAEVTDLFLYDIKIVDDARHIRYTGVPSGPVISNLRMLAAAGNRVIVRFPLVPGVNDDDDNVRAVGRLVASLGDGVPLSVLPYHKIGIDKYDRLGLIYRDVGALEPDEAVISRITGILGGYVKELQIGG